MINFQKAILNAENTKVSQKHGPQNSKNMRTAILAHSTIYTQNMDII